MKAFVYAILLASCLITGITLLSIWSQTTNPSYSDARPLDRLTGLA